MALPALSGINGATGLARIGARTGVEQPAAPGFGDLLTKGLREVSQLEFAADAATESLATGGGAKVHDVMVANTQSSLAVDLLVQVRNRAVEAYQEIMRMQV